MDMFMQGGLILLIPAALALIGAVVVGRWKRSNEELAGEIVETDQAFAKLGLPRTTMASHVQQHSQGMAKLYGETRRKLMLVGFIALAVALSLMAYSLTLPS